MIQVIEKVSEQNTGKMTRAFLKQMLRQKIGGRYPSTFRHSLKTISEELGFSVGEAQTVFEPILAELTEEIRMRPVLEYTRHNGNPILDLVLVMSHERISYDTEKYVCCGGTYSIENQKTYHNCRVQYENGHETWYGLFSIFPSGCPNCSEKSRMKKVKKTRSGSYFVWKYGSRIISISDSMMLRRFTLGQEVVSNGRFLVPQGIKGHVTCIDTRGTEILHVRFVDNDEVHCKFKDLEPDDNQRMDRPEFKMKQLMRL